MKTIYTELAAVAPSINFCASRAIDHSFQWDGDGPDPIEEGYYPHDVTVKARTILRGLMVEGQAHLGGSYFKRFEPTGAVHGYLPQMLKEALDELKSQLITESQSHLFAEIEAAGRLLTNEMHKGYADRLAA